MKTIILTLIFSFPIVLSAQNWAPINPNRSPQFGHEAGENIDFSIKIDSTATDQVFTKYYLHPTYLICDTCTGPISECTSSYNSLYLKQTPLLGDSIMLHDERYWFFGSDLVVQPSATLGFSYDFSLNGSETLTATVTEYTEMEVFGILDSIKNFSISDNREIVLSKNYGIISYTRESGNTQILSGIPELQLGDYFPGMREFYNFEVGDAFLYTGSMYSSQSSTSWLYRVDITGVLLFTDSVKIFYNTTGKSTGWNPYPSSTSTYSSQNSVLTVPFKNHSLQGIIPGMVSYQIDSIKMFSAYTDIEPTSPYSNSYFAIATEHNGRRGLSIGGFTADFESSVSYLDYVDMVYPAGEEATASSIICGGEDGYTNYLLNDSITNNLSILGFGEVFSEYVAGLGATCFYQEFGLVNNLTFMIGYQKGEEVYGNLISVGEILDAREILTEVQVQIFPNPARTHITVSIPDKYSGTFDVSLTDMAGRRVFNQNGLHSNGSIDIQTLPSGTYIMFGTNAEFTFTRKVVVE